MTETFCKLIKDNTNKNEIEKVIKNMPRHMLSLFHYFSLYCLSKNKGHVEIAKNILFYIDKLYYKPFTGTVTLTFGEVAESHVGMQKIGHMSENGFSLHDLKLAQKYFKNKGCNASIIKLNDYLPLENSIQNLEEIKHLKIARKEPEFEAYILIVRDGLKCLDEKKENLLTELLLFEWDTKLYNERRDIVQNKNARHNLNFDKIGQVANFEEGKGTTIPWNNVPLVNKLKKSLVDAFGDSAKGLKCEGNKYYNYIKTGIGYHGDTERRKVIGVRLGKSMNMHFMWYYNFEPRGKNVSFVLNSGDIYCMSEKTVGTDWKANLSKGWINKRYTLRHAAGAPVYTTNTAKIKIKDIKPDIGDINSGDIYYKPKKSVKNPKPEFTKISINTK